jgi:hypothetical protein
MLRLGEAADRHRPGCGGSAPAKAQEPAKGERVKGAARGAAAGAAVGAIAGDTGARASELVQLQVL